MSLVAAGRVELPTKSGRRTVVQHPDLVSGDSCILSGLISGVPSILAGPGRGGVLQTLSAGVTSLADRDPEASRLVLTMCTRVRY